MQRLAAAHGVVSEVAPLTSSKDRMSMEAAGRDAARRHAETDRARCAVDQR